MSTLFVTSDLFPISVRFVRRKLKSGLTGLTIVENDEAAAKYGDQLEQLVTQWQQPNWKQQNDCIRSATYFDKNSGAREVDWPLYRQHLMETFMKSWDVSEEGKSVTCEPSNMNRLDPGIAGYLVDQFLTKVSITEEDLGN